MLTTRASAAGLPALKSSRRRSEDTGEDPLLFPPHARRHSLRAVGMVVAEYVKRTVHYKSEQLFSGPDALAPSVPAGDFGTNIHVANDSSAPPGSTQTERDHVGRTMMPEVAAASSRGCRPTPRGEPHPPTFSFFPP